jgi:anti-sigma-K factor RskA
MNATANDAPEREQIEELLPWHAVGTLSRRDAQRVEQALENDPDLARRFALVREEMSETIHLNETLGAPSSRAMERLLAGIETESGPARQARPSFSLSAWISEQLSALSPRTLAWSATAAVLAIALQAGLLASIYVGGKPGAGSYGTASLSQDRGTGAAGSFVLVSFAPQATVSEITNVLKANGLTVVEGPRGDGFYKVQALATGAPKEDAGQVAARLSKDNPVVLFAAPGK